ncbi:MULTISPECIES: DUF4865 family protein [Pantoea]|uniref:DUF4865 family protein n=1 Tax=Pantoea brenneri TaxID=472694 RepID=A0ABU9MPI8_9GAMM|nr:DUF4865 family protein [Pantoea sp. 3.5.1]
MIVMHYRFTLSADYPMATIEQRIRLNGARLDGFPGLIAKAYLYARLDDDHWQWQRTAMRRSISGSMRQPCSDSCKARAFSA